MKISLIVLVLGMLFSGKAEAKDPYSGNDLILDCKAIVDYASVKKRSNKFNFISGRCLGYVSGIFHLVQIQNFRNAEIPGAKPIACFSDGVNTGQIIRVVIKYLEKNPSNTHRVGVLLIEDAIKQAFPCPENK